jgi:methionyl-tRNA formyltransferase
MCGETETGITLMKMDEGLDTGDIIAQSKISIESSDTRETIYEKLYRLGAQELPQWLNSLETLGPWRAQASFTGPYAALLKRDDGYIPWNILQGDSLKIENIPSKHLQIAFKNNHNLLQVLPRALAGFPTLWTIVPTTKGDKRMKILSFEPYIVQIEGQQPSHFKQIKNQLTK